MKADLGELKGKGAAGCVVLGNPATKVALDSTLMRICTCLGFPKSISIEEPGRPEPEGLPLGAAVDGSVRTCSSICKKA